MKKIVLRQSPLSVITFFNYPISQMFEKSRCKNTSLFCPELKEKESKTCFLSNIFVKSPLRKTPGSQIKLLKVDKIFPININCKVIINEILHHKSVEFICYDLLYIFDLA